MMTKTHPKNSIFSRTCGVCALALCAWLAACAPGTGGTGTGPSIATNTVTAASPLTFTSAVGAATTTTTTAVSVASPAPSPGVANACTGASAQVSLLLESARITASSSACGTLTYVGAWAVDGNGQTQIQGTWQASGAAASVPATALLVWGSAGIASTSLTLSVRTADGTAVLGPVVVYK